MVFMSNQYTYLIYEQDGKKRGELVLVSLLYSVIIVAPDAHAGSLKQKKENKESNHELSQGGLPWSRDCASFLTEPVAS